MNLPNRITIARLAVCPFFIGALLLYGHSGHEIYYAVALSLFTLAAVSDGLDGYLARSRNQRTQLGALLDPLADKILLDSTVIVLAVGIGNLYRIPVWFVLIILCRDFILLFLSLCLFQRWSRGEVKITPNLWGKTSAVLLMATVIWILLHPYRPQTELIRFSLYATALTVGVSGVTYLIGTLKAVRLSRHP